MALMTKSAPQPTLEDRITALRSEIDALIEKRVGDLKSGYGPYPPADGVPESVLRNILMNRAGDCLCKAALNISEAGEPLR